ncbi:MAG: hypothetical protein H7Y22_08085 [Gemmatimonadaceae bacterium]|nr:hypothetical protein [Gloeobacterales cyanobacterium ES-bin-141]
MQCSRCGVRVSAGALECPQCQLPLKAHGHPGVSVSMAPGGEILCPTCAYHHDGSCTFPDYPEATRCTLYRDTRARPPQVQPGKALPRWNNRWNFPALLGLLFLGSLLLTLLR